MSDDPISELSQQLTRWADSTHRFTPVDVLALGPAPRRHGAGLLAALAIFVLVIGSVIAGMALRSDDQTTADTSPTSPTLVSGLIGSPLPPVIGTTADGATVDLASLRGSPVILDISATWCQPCITKLPDLVRTASSADTQIVTVAFEDDLQALEDRVREAGGAWPVVELDSATLTSLGLSAVPATIRISPTGIVDSVTVD